MSWTSGRRAVSIIMKATSLAIVASLAVVYCQLPAAEISDGPRVRTILEETGVQGGLVVHLGCGDGKLTAALRANDRLLVHGLDADAKNVAAARQHIESRGLHGRVSVDRWNGERLPYADNLVNLIVISGPSSIARAELLRVLVPNGVAVFLPNDQGPMTKEKLVKPWPRDIDEWTHWLHGPDGNAVSRDTVAGPPRHMQWIADPLWSRHHNTVPSVSAQVTARGRLFYIVDDAPVSMSGSAPDRWALVARDAFNGILLWRKPIPEWGWKVWSADWTCRFTVPTNIPNRLVAVGDSVYVTLGYNAPLTELDAATGTVRRTFAGSDFTDEILAADGKLIVALNQAAQGPGPAQQKKAAVASPPPVPKSVAMFDAGSGRMLWKVGDYVGLRSKTASMDRINHLSLVAGGGRIFFVDRDELIGLSGADGRELWRTPRPAVPEHEMRYDIRLTDMVTLVHHDGVLLFAQLNPDRRIDWREVRGELQALDAATGRTLWTHSCAAWGWAHPADVFVVQGLAWIHDYRNDKIVGLDPRTGQTRREISNFKAFDNGHHHRCYRNKATERFMMTSYRGYEFIDWASGETTLNHWVRGTCRLGGFPCNGLIYSNPHPCECYIDSKLNGMLALAGESQEVEESESRRVQESRSNANRVERGPAVDISGLESQVSEAADWPTFRHDPQRSGATPDVVAAPFRKGWESELGGAATGCTAAEGMVFTACPERHAVHGLRATDGARQWRFTASGPVDTPPTYDRGRVYFGCAGGWVYCLRAADGALVWRFFAAPGERLIGAFGRLESAWPVHGSVLVRDGAVYAVAGRSSFLDGGLVAWVLDADTGAVRQQQRIASSPDMQVGTGTAALAQAEPTGYLSDLLVGDGTGIYMRRHRLFEDGGEGTPMATGVLHALGGLLDDTWFSRTRWLLDNRPLADYLVFDAARVYGVRARKAKAANDGFVTPGTDGYELFAAERNTADPATPAPKKKRPVANDAWAVRMPTRVNALALAGGTLLAAGTPDTLDPQEPWAAYDGKRGGTLYAIDSDSGAIRQRLELDSAPAYEGLSVAFGRLYLSTRDGKLICFEPTKGERR